MKNLNHQIHPLFFSFIDQQVDFKGPFDQEKNESIITELNEYKALFEGVKKEIFSIETSKNQYLFTDLKKLDIGNFYWTIQGIDTEYKRKSPVARSEFTIKLGDVKKTNEPIKIELPKDLYLD